MTTKTLSYLLKTSSVLWMIWGFFHLFLGIALLVVFGSEYPSGSLQSIPETVTFEMFGMDNLLATVPALKQLSFYLGWFGLTVMVGSIYVWKKNKLGIFICAFIGGFADLGYFLYVDLPGYAASPGPEMTYIMALAIILAFTAYFKSDRLKRFN